MKIKMIAATIAAAFSTSAFSIGYDAEGSPLSGDAQYERHVWQTYTAVCEAPPAGLCAATGSTDGEVLGIIGFSNASQCTLSGGVCVPTPATKDRYCGNKAGNPAIGTPDCTGTPAGTTLDTSSVPNQDALWVYSPNAAAITSELGSLQTAVAAVGADTGSTTTYAWDFTTDVNGKIICEPGFDSFYVADTQYQSNTIVGIVNLCDTASPTGASLTTYVGDITLLDLSCILGAGGTANNVCNSGTYGDPAGLTYSASNPLSYITEASDEVGGGKAVPMPAFAAAALGLGLIGVTTLTGRRRQVK